MASRVRLNTEGFKKIREKMDIVLPIALAQTAEIIRDDMKVRAAKDTEFMAESIYISTNTASDYDSAKKTAEARSNAAKSLGITPKGVRIGPNARYEMLPEIRPDEPLTVNIVVGAAHGYYNEYGTPFRGPKPFMLPAVNANRGTLSEQVRLVYSGATVKSLVTSFSQRK